jgi:hypothetical protein
MPRIGFSERIRMKKIIVTTAVCFLCIAPNPSFAQSIFWTELGGGTIDSSAFNGSGFNPIAAGLYTPYGVAIETGSGKLYWTNVLGGEIMCSNRDASSPTPLVEGLSLPRGIAIDESNGMMYWVENGSKTLRSATLDGLSVQDILTSGLSAPTGIAVDGLNGEIYWTDNGGGTKYIGRCDLNGGNATHIYSTTNFVSGIAVDIVHSQIYWTEYGPSRSIMAANLDGSNVIMIESISASNPRGIFVASLAGMIFWTDYLTNQIETASLNGSGESVIVSGLNNPLSIYGSGGIDYSLAVQLSDFKVVSSSFDEVELRWQTQSEIDNVGFNILRADGPAATFKLISSYTSNDSLKGMGTSSSGRAYDFTDNKVVSGKTYQYKIQSVSTNGTMKDLSTLTVTVDVPKNYALYQNYPNPFNPSTTIRFDLKQTSSVTLEVYNVLGQRLEYWNYGTMDAGRYNKNVNLDAFASGVYYYRILAQGNNGEKFESMKKLVLMK